MDMNTETYFFVFIPFACEAQKILIHTKINNNFSQIPKVELYFKPTSIIWFVFMSNLKVGYVLLQVTADVIYFFFYCSTIYNRRSD